MKQQSGLYTIELSDGKKIPLRFCTWSLNRFCEINGNLTLIEMQKVLSEDMSLNKFMSLVLCAAEYMCIKNNADFTYTAIDAADWIDGIGGIGGKGMQDMLLAVTESVKSNSKTAKHG